MIEISRSVYLTSRVAVILFSAIFMHLLCRHAVAVDYGEINVTPANCEEWGTNLSSNTRNVPGNIIVNDSTITRGNYYYSGRYESGRRDNVTNNTVLASGIHIETENVDCCACHISGYRYGAEDSDEYLVLRNDGEDVTLGRLPVNFTEREHRIQRVGHTWDLGCGYLLTVQEVDLRGRKARLELIMDGVVLESEVVEEGGVFMYNTTIYDRKGHVINDVTVFQVRVGRVFRG